MGGLFEESGQVLLNTPVTNARVQDLSGKVIEDPFDQLPYDILHVLAPYLAIVDLKSLMRASYHVHSLAANNSVLWKSLLKREMIPLFPYLPAFLDRLMEKLDPKRHFMYLDYATTARLGMQGRWMHAANRRRIRNVCQTIADVYHSRKSEEAGLNNLDHDYQQCYGYAMSLYMPRVAYPNSKDVSSVSAEFFDEYADLDKPCQFKVYWTRLQEGDYTVAGFSLETEREVASSHYCGHSDVSITTAKDLAKDEKINEIVLYIPGVNMLKSPKVLHDLHSANDVEQEKLVYIKGVTVGDGYSYATRLHADCHCTARLDNRRRG